MQFTFFFRTRSRNFHLFLKLVALDTDASENHKLVEEIQVLASGLGFFEAFLEAGPQFILQLSIVLRLGYASKK